MPTTSNSTADNAAPVFRANSPVFIEYLVPCNMQGNEATLEMCVHRDAAIYLGETADFVVIGHTLTTFGVAASMVVPKKCILKMDVLSVLYEFEGSDIEIELPAANEEEIKAESEAVDVIPLRK